MKVVIVGGGIVGLWTAYELLTAGVEVAVIDGGDIGGVAATASAGWIVEATSAPLASPGAPSDIARQILRGQPAFRVHPRPSVARWVASFAASAGAQQSDRGLRGTLELAAGAKQRYRELVPDGVEIHDDGLMLASMTGASLAKSVRSMERALGAGYVGTFDVLEGNAISEREPSLSRKLAGVVHVRDEAWVSPDSALEALRSRVVSLGGSIARKNTVGKIVPKQGDRWSVICTDPSATEFSGDRVVIAAGVWSVALLRPFGLNVPLLPGTGYGVAYSNVTGRPHHAMKLVEPNIAVSPLQSETRIVGRFDLGRFGGSVPSRRLAAMLRHASTYFDSWDAGAPVRRFAGMRPMTPDNLPLIGELRRAPGLFVATGHGMHGMMLAPATGRAIATLITTGESTPWSADFRPERYGR